jgi:hypothetical protein
VVPAQAAGNSSASGHCKIMATCVASKKNQNKNIPMAYA